MKDSHSVSKQICSTVHCLREAQGNTEPLKWICATGVTEETGHCLCPEEPQQREYHWGKFSHRYQSFNNINEFFLTETQVSL